MAVARASLVAAAFGLPSTLCCAAAERLAAPHLGSCGPAAGGFLLPGTEACLTIGGSVHTERVLTLAQPILTLASSVPGRSATRPDRFAGAAFGTGARLSADLRVPTASGPFRAFVSLRVRNGFASDRAAR